LSDPQKRTRVRSENIRKEKTEEKMNVASLVRILGKIQLGGRAKIQEKSLRKQAALRKRSETMLSDMGKDH